MIYAMSNVWHRMAREKNAYIPYAIYSYDNYYNDQREYHRVLFRLAENCL